MYVVSLKLRLPSCVTIHNQCSNIKLISPVYFGNGALCPKLSDQQIGIGTEMSACFEINSIQNNFEGALLYELQRYSARPHKDIVTAKAVTKSTPIHMLVIWKMKGSEPFGHIMLLKNIRGFKWNEEKLRKFCNKNYDRLKGYGNTTLVTWLIDDSMVLKTVLEIRKLKENFELNIYISEEEEVNYTIRPFWIDKKR
jgi:hypothetical protein